MGLFEKLFGETKLPVVLPDICPLSQHGSAHDEDLISKTIFKSPFQQMTMEWPRSSYKRDDFTQKIVFIFKCKTCGRIRKDTELSQEE